MRAAIFILAVLSFTAGCDQDQSGPLDDATLDILSRTGMHSADVTYPDGYCASLTSDEYDMMRSLIAALGPIESATQGTLDDYDYELIFTTGMDPAFIKVKLGNDSEFTYEWGGVCIHRRRSEAFSGWRGCDS